MAWEGGGDDAVPFLWKAEHKRVGAELSMKRGRWWCLMLVEKDGERGRSSIEGRIRCGLLQASGSTFYRDRIGAQAVGRGG
jgi:hypothetical protein